MPTVRTQMKPTETGWAVLNRGGNIIVNTIRNTRTSAISSWCEGEQWPRWKRMGFNCRRVAIVLVKKC